MKDSIKTKLQFKLYQTTLVILTLYRKPKKHKKNNNNKNQGRMASCLKAGI